ncbi:MAG: hypothetical protein E6R04_06730 [Spirochaetes bacterium]|nr:MAG: hypothetical protein E6R04_06730 [Spirochaetota bacterium]
MTVSKTLTEMPDQELATLLLQTADEVDRRWLFSRMSSETFRIRRIADGISRRSGGVRWSMTVAKTLTEMSDQELATLLLQAADEVDRRWLFSRMSSETFRIRRIADEISRRSGR